MAHSAGLARLVQPLLGRLTMSYERWAMTLLLLVFVLDYADRTLIGARGGT